MAEHTADCVEKCTKDGSKAQIWNEKDDKPYNLSEFRKVKAYVGKKVTIQGTLDKKTNTIAVETVSPAPSSEASLPHVPQAVSLTAEACPAYSRGL